MGTYFTKSSINCHMVHPLRFTTMHAHGSRTLASRSVEKIKTPAQGRTSTLPEFYARKPRVARWRTPAGVSSSKVLIPLGEWGLADNTRSESKRQSARARASGGKERQRAEQKTERERKPEKGNISDDWYCRRCARDAECRGVESAVFKWGGH